MPTFIESHPTHYAPTKSFQGGFLPSYGEAGKTLEQTAKNAFWTGFNYRDRWSTSKEILSSTSGAGEAFMLQCMLPIIQEIRRSTSILELTFDWDGEGGSGYELATWLRAISFLINNATNLWRESQNYTEPPRILPGPDGSIDLHWKNSKRELLINIPSSSDEAIAYYGDNINGQEVKGDIETDNSQWLLAWLNI